MPAPTKKVSAEVNRRRGTLLPIVVVLLLAGGFLQNQIDPTVRKMQVGMNNINKVSGGLTNEFMLLPLLGFREAAAGLLWVRCDEFFHSGDYDAILPLVRLITWLDPHAENVFVTGAWHLAYNFTDSSERSDRRYISPAQALLDEGILHNMNIPDIKFEKGWQNYDKIKDYVVAEKAFKMAIDGPLGNQKAMSKEADDYPYASPLKTHHILAHTYEKMGRIPDAIAEWNRALARCEKHIQEEPKEYKFKQLRAAELHNIDINQKRYADRYTTSNHTPVNPTPYPAVIRPPFGSTKTGPWDVAFQPEIEVIRPKVLKIRGRFNSADGMRVDVRITDWDYKERQLAGKQLETFEVDMTQTILVDMISVRKNKFEREMDMSRDPKMYGFSSDFYKITLSFNPRTTSPHIQDRFGWSGEGLTDSNASHLYLDKRPEVMGTKMIEGQGGEGPLWDGKTVPWAQYGQPIRMVKVTYKVPREAFMSAGIIPDKYIVPNE